LVVEADGGQSGGMTDGGATGRPARRKAAQGGTAQQKAAQRGTAQRKTAHGHAAPGAEAREKWTFPFEADLNEVAPALLRSQNAWLAQIDSLSAPDRKTHELIRMVCSVIARNPQGIRRHAMLAAEVGASWEEVAGSVILAEPAFGILVAVEAFPWARKGWERGSSMEDEEEQP